MAAVASSASFPQVDDADLLSNLSLNPKTKTEDPAAGNEAVYDGTGGFFGQLRTDQVPLSSEATKGSKPSVLQNGGDVTVNKGPHQKRLGYQKSWFDAKSSYSKGSYPSGFYSPGYQYPGFSYGGNIGLGKNDNLHAYPYLNTHHARTSGLGESYGYIDNIYANHGMYGHYMNTVGTGYGYGSYGNDCWKHGQGWYAFNNGYKTRNYGFNGFGKENIDGLNELNRGPRAKGFKNQEGPQPATLAAKEQNILETENSKEKGFLPDTEDYNSEDFCENYIRAKFFVIKSYSEDDIHKSIKYNVWSSTPNGNKKLDAAYSDANKLDACPIFLLFSVNTSGQFVGLAEMVGPVDFNKTVEYWQQDKWIGCFPVKWHIIKDVPNSSLRHITLTNNENKPVTNSRDTQEVNLEQGIKIIKIFKDHSSKTCILDDFVFYEGRQKIIQEKKAKQQQFKKQVFDGKPGLVAGSEGKDNNTTSDDGLQKTEERTSEKEAESKGEVDGEAKLLKENGSAVSSNGFATNGVASAC